MVSCNTSTMLLRQDFVPLSFFVLPSCFVFLYSQFFNRTSCSKHERKPTSSETQMIQKSLNTEMCFSIWLIVHQDKENNNNRQNNCAEKVTECFVQIVIWGFNCRISCPLHLLTPHQQVLCLLLYILLLSFGFLYTLCFFNSLHIIAKNLSTLICVAQPWRLRSKKFSQSFKTCIWIISVFFDLGDRTSNTISSLEKWAYGWLLMKCDVIWPSGSAFIAIQQSKIHQQYLCLISIFNIPLQFSWTLERKKGIFRNFLILCIFATEQ